MPAGKPENAAASGRDGRKDDRAKDGENKAGRSEVEEIGGPKGPEPTRYGDWEKGGRCSDF